MRAGEGILVVAGSVFLATAVACGVEYEVVVLGPDAACTAISDGQGGGYVERGDEDGEPSPHAALWLDGGERIVDLNPDGCLASQVWDASGGRQVGMGDGHALLWSGTAGSVVDLHPPDCDRSCAYGVWGDRQVGAGMAASVGEHALLWSGTAESVVDLHPAGFATSRAGGIWGDRQVGYGVPMGEGRTDWQALLWSGSAGRVVNLHPPGFRSSCAYGAWGNWQAGVGVPANGKEMHALLWSGTAESVVDLHPKGYEWSYIVHCWGNRQVGVADDHALLWSGSAAGAVDLHRFLPDKYTYSGAFGIDATGRIAGYAGNDAERHAVIWVPRLTAVYKCSLRQGSGCLLTTQGDEVERLLAADPNAWVFEGIVCHVPPDSRDPNAMPVYRFGTRDRSDHFYTIDADERDKLFRDYRDVWAYEGIAFYAYRPSRRPSSAVAVYRFWSDSLGCHLYTRSEAERTQLLEQKAGVWTCEGVAWYAYE